MPSTINHRVILDILKKTDFNPTIAMRRQLTLHVRELILQRKLAPKSRLPPIKKMAELWGTNYFTVQTALRPLVGEGLLLQAPKKGTFVASRREKLRRVCLYHEYDLSSDWHNEFYSLLNIWCYRLFSERGIISVPYFDHRPKDQRAQAPAEIKNMVRERKIDAVIATCIAPGNASWLLDLGIPFASPLMNQPPHRVAKTYLPELARLLVAEAKKVGAKTIGIATVLDKADKSIFNLELEKLTAKMKISVIYPQTIAGPLHWESTGFKLGRKLMKLTPRPDLIFVYPDSLIRGVATALLQSHARIPKQLGIVSHRNAESHIYLPFPVTWLTVKIEDMARALIRRLDRQVAGKKSDEVELAVSVERTRAA